MGRRHCQAGLTGAHASTARRREGLRGTRAGSEGLPPPDPRRSRRRTSAQRPAPPPALGSRIKGQGAGEAMTTRVLSPAPGQRLPSRRRERADNDAGAPEGERRHYLNAATGSAWGTWIPGFSVERNNRSRRAPQRACAAAAAAMVTGRARAGSAHALGLPATLSPPHRAAPSTHAPGPSASLSARAAPEARVRGVSWQP